jgi:two-component system, NtrC family, sensor kinase
MKSLRLLMVDDETVFLNTLVDRLKRRGITPVAAESGEACLALMAQQPFDVVVLDVKMPGLGGLEVLSYIKRDYPQTEVIFLTGHGSTADGVAGIKAGAFDYLTKPVEFLHLLEKIKQAFDKRKRAEEKAREAEFREKMDRQLTVTERLASLGTLATGVAHEINNPLAIIQEWAGWMKSILEELGTGFPHQEDFNLALTKIETAIGRAKRITHQLLGMAQKETDTLVEISAADLISDAVNLVNGEVLNRNITIQYTPEPHPLIFRSDPYRLRQVLINLLNNAIHATPAGGSITLGATAEGDEVLFQVQDTGTGISPENLEKIFEPFFTTKPTGEGTGLGLFISRRLVEKLGGKIEAESRPGQGALFRIRLPSHPFVKSDVTSLPTVNGRSLP